MAEPTEPVSGPTLQTHRTRRRRRRLTHRGHAAAWSVAMLSAACVVTLPLATWAIDAGMRWMYVQQFSLSAGFFGIGTGLGFFSLVEAEGAFTTTEDTGD